MHVEKPSDENGLRPGGDGRTDEARFAEAGGHPLVRALTTLGACVPGVRVGVSLGAAQTDDALSLPPEAHSDPVPFQVTRHPHAAVSDLQVCLVADGQEGIDSAWLRMGQALSVLAQSAAPGDTPADLLEAFQTAFEHCPRPVAKLDRDLRVAGANAAFRAFWCGDPMSSVEGLVPFPVRVAAHLQAELAHAASWQGELTLLLPGGREVPVDVALVRLQGARSDNVAVWLYLSDLSAQHAARTALERLAFEDPTTRLPNRSRLAERLGLALADVRREQAAGAVLTIDLLGFRAVNALYGYRHGDAVLRACGARITDALTPADAVYRTGANEFVALLRFDRADPAAAHLDARARAQQILDRLQAPLTVAGTAHRLGAAIGMRCFPEGLESADDVLRDADVALQAAKAAGPGRAVQHEPGQRQAVTAGHRLEQDLRHAVERGELRMYLQPQFDAAGRMRAAEALVRWQHPRRGLLAPDAFLPLAEETGLVLDIDRWMLGEACRQIVRTHEAGCALDIAVNVSALHLAEGSLCTSVFAALQAEGALAAGLTLELTETMLIDGSEVAQSSLARLRAAGVRLSIDDFGTGYSNLRLLGQLCVDELKIDRSLVAPLNHDPKAVDLLDFILRLAEQLATSVVAEGVETQSQADMLIGHGCRRLQGYHFARPAPAEEVLLTWFCGPQALMAAPVTGSEGTV